MVACHTDGKSYQSRLWIDFIVPEISNYIKQVIRRTNIDEIPYIEFKYGVFRMDKLHDRYLKP